MNKKILVVMGGPSSEAEVSRRTGAAICKALKAKGHDAEQLEFSPKTFLHQIDEIKPAVVFNAMHGAWGEDGRLAALLDFLNIPCTGCGFEAAVTTVDKAVAKDVMIAHHIPTPPAVAVKKYGDRRQAAEAIASQLGLPAIIKAVTQGSTIGIYIADTVDETIEALNKAFEYDEVALAEKIIKGTELTVSVLGSGNRVEVLPTIEITTTTGRYDYETKYTAGLSNHIIPARISDNARALVERTARVVFLAFNLKGPARIDIMLEEGTETPYVIDINTVPGMTETSLFPDAAKAAGLEFSELCEKILRLAGFEI